MPYDELSVYMQDKTINHTTDFGFKTVNSELKTGMVQNLFQNVSNKYDIMNDFMSLGLHRIWKKIFINKISIRNNYKILDLAGGTGDIAIALHKKNNYLNPLIYVCDLTFDMILNGRNKAYDNAITSINWQNGNAEFLPYKDSSFDTVTIAFGLRNVTNKEKAIQEMVRVLKPGGKLYCLEFSDVSKHLKNIYDFYSFKLIPFIGSLVANNKDAYEYLVESIRTFPKAEKLKQIFIENGFKESSFEKLNGGIVAIHTCTKSQ